MRSVILSSFVTLLAPSLPAIPDEEEPRLKVGDPAPALQIAKWVKGEPINVTDGKDKSVFVVEFWATWCGPCVRSIPHVTKFQQRFEKKGLVVIGVSVDDESTRDNVAPFVKKMGDKMGYRVAIDDGGKTNAAYMEAALEEGIPHAFIIGKDGKIAWHGHPMAGMDLKLAEMVGDQEYAESARKVHAAREELQAGFRKASEGEGGWDPVLKTLDKLIALEPEETQALVFKYQILAIEKKDAPAAAKAGAEAVEKIDDAETLNMLAWAILNEPEFKGIRDRKLALTAARKADALSEGKDWRVVDTHARACYETGDEKKAVELQKKAIELAKKEIEVAKKEGDVEEDLLAQLQETLKRYEAGPAKEEKEDGEEEEKKEEKPAKEDGGEK
jgi:thiol-disulfide isomerase/thioredoxin